ncbi:NUDIX domain-containing protein [Streptomyces olivoreticuli]|uniref:NUDIX domain-containing protein n=1 Tax=Streptomyces olivoreticuli TaxID=68246 RepID=UPI000E27B354|nr:NUDIX domain-containing protein [Streptomyces olivoreticuli]
MTTQQPADGFYLRNAASGLVVRDGLVLLARGTWPDPNVENYWLPGGGQQPGETLAACAEREVLEETGVRVTAGQMLLLREHIPGNHPESNIPPETGHHRVEAVFWCEILHEPAALGGTNHDDDQTGIEWVPLDKVASLSMIPPFLQRLLPGLAVQAAAGMAHAFYAGDVE